MAERGLVFLMFDGEVRAGSWPAEMPSSLVDRLGHLHRSGVWSGGAGEIERYLGIEPEGALLTLAVGLGAPGEMDAARQRCLGGAIIRLLRDSKQWRAVIVLPGAAAAGERPDGRLRPLVDAILCATHALPRIGADASLNPDLTVEFAPGSGLHETIARAKARAVNTARDLAWMPPNILTPQHMAEQALALSDDAEVTADLLDPAALRERGFGAILAVAEGSRADALLVHLRYRPAGAINDKPIVLIGKSVTFDSGGTSLKPALAMDRMKADMAGGAAVIGALQAALDLHLPIAIDVILPIVENMAGGGAMRPGDVIRSYSGTTIEVLNTDAEGRLILADALALAKEQDPDCVIDVATLTGASAIVFGPMGIGTFVNDGELRKHLFGADRDAGEKLWELPLWPEYLDLMKSPIADLANISSTIQNGSMMTAASFLHTFISPVAWAHLDIYNSAWAEFDHPVLGKGPTGAGTATLVEFLVRKAGWTA